MEERKIIHIDMDAFYASVEVLDNPALKGLPVVVGGKPESRGVVTSASYEARRFGIRSAMASSVAKRLCPDAVFLPSRMRRYQELSREIHAIFRQYTELVEPISIDEAWLDVTENLRNIPSATRIAQMIKQQIETELHLTCSAGVSYNKFLAKIASDERKPDGLFVITPKDAPQFLQNIEVRKIPGVGKVTQTKLKGLGIQYGRDLLEKSEVVLTGHFGKMGTYLFQIIRGIDNRSVVSHRDYKSVSVESTFATDLLYGEEILARMEKLVDGLMKRLDRKSLYGRTVTLKVKFQDFKQITRSMSETNPFQTKEAIFECAKQKLKHVCQHEYPKKRIRLIGVGISNFSSDSSQKDEIIQLDFFAE